MCRWARQQGLSHTSTTSAILTIRHKAPRLKRAHLSQSLLLSSATLPQALRTLVVMETPQSRRRSPFCQSSSYRDHLARERPTLSRCSPLPRLRWACMNSKADLFAADSLCRLASGVLETFRSGVAGVAYFEVSIEHTERQCVHHNIPYGLYIFEHLRCFLVMRAHVWCICLPQNLVQMFDFLPVLRYLLFKTDVLSFANTVSSR